MAGLVLVPLVLAVVALGPGGLAAALAPAMLAAAPLGISLWALLDAARRPQWAWALAERRQVVWMAVILVGIVTVLGGLAVSGWYLLKVRPVVAAAEEGRIAGP
jgi:hypothetical protein